MLGEFILQQYVSHLARRDIVKASAGWAGDRFSLLEGPLGERALVDLIVWESAEDAQEFFDIISGSQEVSEDFHIGINEDQVLINIGPQAAVLERLRSQFPGL